MWWTRRGHDMIHHETLDMEELSSEAGRLGNCEISRIRPLWDFSFGLATFRRRR